jgi:hypothetical protein
MAKSPSGGLAERRHRRARSSCTTSPSAHSEPLELARAARRRAIRNRRAKALRWRSAVGRRRWRPARPGCVARRAIGRPSAKRSFTTTKLVSNHPQLAGQHIRHIGEAKALARSTGEVAAASKQRTRQRAIARRVPRIVARASRPGTSHPAAARAEPRGPLPRQTSARKSWPRQHRNFRPRRATPRPRASQSAAAPSPGFLRASSNIWRDLSAPIHATSGTPRSSPQAKSPCRTRGQALGLQARAPSPAIAPRPPGRRRDCPHRRTARRARAPANRWPCLSRLSDFPRPSKCGAGSSTARTSYRLPGALRSRWYVP